VVTEPKFARGFQLPGLLMILSAVTGLVDAISILGMGRVFTANMTGNVVFFGFAVGGAPGFEMMRYIVALVAFLLGAWAGGRIGKAYEGAPHRPWLLRVAFLEAGLFWAAALVALRYDINALAPTSSLYAMIALAAVAMGLRNATVRQVKVPDMTTTVLTLKLTGLAADSTLAGGANPNWQRRIGGAVVYDPDRVATMRAAVRPGRVATSLTLRRHCWRWVSAQFKRQHKRSMVGREFVLLIGNARLYPAALQDVLERLREQDVVDLVSLALELVRPTRVDVVLAEVSRLAGLDKIGPDVVEPADASQRRFTTTVVEVAGDDDESALVDSRQAVASDEGCLRNALLVLFVAAALAR